MLPGSSGGLVRGLIGRLRPRRCVLRLIPKPSKPSIVRRRRRRRVASRPIGHDRAHGAQIVGRQPRDL
ncbi:hypothetical protein ABTG42_19560, partial [Acinetobacter baumannii]